MTTPSRVFSAIYNMCVSTKQNSPKNNPFDENLANEEQKEKEEEYFMIENVFNGPGGIDRVFEWHRKNNIIINNI